MISGEPNGCERQYELCLQLHNCKGNRLRSRVCFRSFAGWQLSFPLLFSSIAWTSHHIRKIITWFKCLSSVLMQQKKKIFVYPCHGQNICIESDHNIKVSYHRVNNETHFSNLLTCVMRNSELHLDWLSNVNHISWDVPNLFLPHFLDWN